MKSFKEYLRFIIIQLLISSCHIALHKKIINHINNVGDFKDSIQLNLNDLVEFRWDTLFVFGQITPPEDISKALGFNYYGSLVQEHRNRIVFVFKGKVAYEDDYPDPDYSHSFIDFTPLMDTTSSNIDYICYPNEDSIFVVYKEKWSCKNCYTYNLNPLKNYSR